MLINWRYILLVVFVCSLNQGVTQDKSYPEHFGDVFGSDKLLLGKRIFTGDVGYAFQNVAFIDNMGEVAEYNRHAFRTNLNINPAGYWFIRTTMYSDFNRTDETPLWLADIFYQVGHYDWRNGRFSFGYENFQPNRFRNAQVDFITNMRRGQFFGSFNFVIEQGDEKRKNPLLFDKTSRIVFTPFIRVHPEYPDMNNDFGGYFKPVGGAFFRYVIAWNFYVEAAVYFYPIARTVVPWDPDYTYSFGLFNWRAFKVNFSYGNWIANRFPWKEQEMPFHRFTNGEFNINLTWAW